MSIEVCEAHDYAKVVYDGKDCPFCKAETKIGGLEEEIDSLRDQIDDMTEETDNAKSA